jgi:hypothetical protein
VSTTPVPARRSSSWLTTTARRADGWLSGVPVYPWLFAAYPVIRLYQENLADVEPGEVVLPLLAVLAATTVGMAIVARLLRDARRAAIVVAAFVVPLLSFGLLMEVLPASLGSARYGVLAMTAVAVAIAVVVARRIRGQLGALTSGLNVLSFVLLIVVSIPAVQGAVDALRIGASPISDPATPIERGSSAAPVRDIYHIILDRYGSERALRTGYGLDNADFVAWLREQGFQVLDDAHANYTWTTVSMAATLGMSLLDGIAAATGPESRNMAPLYRRLAESRAGAFLQDLGYRYIHVGSWFDPTRDSSIADEVVHPTQAVTFASMLTDLTMLPTLLGSAQAARQEDIGRAATAVRFELDELERIRDEPGPKYVLAHLLLPHPPYVFLEDGSVAPKKATFGSQLAFANASLKRFLEPLLALPEDERPIIILQADEGPYPRRIVRDVVGFDWSTATDEDLITKFGILDAWLMPGPEGEAPLPEDMTAVNTYPELFRRYFGARVADAPDRTFLSPKDEPYDLIDITERLAVAEGRQPASARPSRSPAGPSAVSAAPSGSPAGPAGTPVATAS